VVCITTFIVACTRSQDMGSAFSRFVQRVMGGYTRTAGDDEAERPAVFVIDDDDDDEDPGVQRARGSSDDVDLFSSSAGARTTTDRKPPDDDGKDTDPIDRLRDIMQSTGEFIKGSSDGDHRPPFGGITGV
jgi:hypothetical protein